VTLEHVLPELYVSSGQGAHGFQYFPCGFSCTWRSVRTEQPMPHTFRCAECCLCNILVGSRAAPCLLQCVRLVFRHSLHNHCIGSTSHPTYAPAKQAASTASMCHSMVEIPARCWQCPTSTRSRTGKSMMQLTIPTLTPYSKVQPGSGTLRHAVAALQPTTTSAKHAHAIRACRESAAVPRCAAQTSCCYTLRPQ
jgi:hypothetical protein